MYLYLLLLKLIEERDFESTKKVGNSPKFSRFIYPLLTQLAPLVAEMVNNLPAMQEMQVQSQVPWVGKIPRRRENLATPVFLPGELHEQHSLMGYSS